MGKIVDLTSQMPYTSTYTGSLSLAGSNGNNAAMTYIATSDAYPAFSTGSWQYLANTWGAAAIVSSSLSGTLAAGVWHGSDTTWGVFVTPTESIDRSDVTSNATPYPDQGLAVGDWNPFPTPETSTGEQLPPRDLTRYRKSYSSGRRQPARIRLVKP